MRRFAWLTWLVLVSPIATSHTAAQITSSSQASTAEIEALRSRLRALDDERALVAEQLAEAERRAATAAQTSPTYAAMWTSNVVSSGDDVRYLETVVVSGTRREEAIATVPAAVTVVGVESIQDKQRGINLEESLRRVPGALLRDQLGGSTRVTISIRGAGATSADGARGVRLFVDGIPKNNAGGSAQDFINIDLSAAESIEVLRGPSSALYGNQAGGVVSITTESGGPRPAFAFNQVLGSYGYARTHLGGGGQGSGGRFNYFGTAFKNVFDGFRVDSSQDGGGFSGKFGMTIDDRSTLSIVTGYDNQTQGLPGELTAEEMAADPRQANPVAVALGGNVLALDEFRFGGTYRRSFTGAQVEATGYYTPRGIEYLFLETRRFNQSFVNRGATGRLVVPKLFGTPARLTTGLDYQNTPIRSGNFPRSNSPLAGQTIAETEESATTVGPFALVDVALGARVAASGGLRYDRIMFSTENLVRPQDGQSEIVYEQFSPRLGLTFRLTQDVALYTSYNEGFEAPILDQLRTSPSSDGEFEANRTLEPIDVRAFEVGARGQLGRGDLRSLGVSPAHQQSHRQSGLPSPATAHGTVLRVRERRQGRSGRSGARCHVAAVQGNAGGGVIYVQRFHLSRFRVGRPERLWQYRPRRASSQCVRRGDLPDRTGSVGDIRRPARRPLLSQRPQHGVERPVHRSPTCASATISD